MPSPSKYWSDQYINPGGNYVEYDPPAYVKGYMGGASHIERAAMDYLYKRGSGLLDQASRSVDYFRRQISGGSGSAVDYWRPQNRAPAPPRSAYPPLVPYGYRFDNPPDRRPQARRARRRGRGIYYKREPCPTAVAA